METKIVGGKIAEARKRMRISQAQLAERLFISPQAVGKWERGESMPDITTFNRMAVILGVDLNYFSEDFQPVLNELTTAEPVAERAAGAPTGEQKAKLGWDMSRGSWVGADFSGLKGLHDKFSASNLQHCKFIGSDLSGLHLDANQVVDCDFSGSNISDSRIERSHVINTVFRECSLKHAVFSTSHFKGCDLSGADLSGAAFKHTSLLKSNLAQAVLARTSFQTTEIAEVVFEGRLEDCQFEDCAFSRVTFQNTTITNTFFKGRSLKRIRFIDCRTDRMTYEFLKNGKADLSGITLLAT
ncbi:MAG: pentapeptide repeat-containing protein [Flavobacteriales bacterium]|nr:pentapeptide repeat-containing protein [Flavobacteriales bacterium]MBP6697687.1 pentapeptide repeat-containing protein [Flavobacteriales bacterium]